MEECEKEAAILCHYIPFHTGLPLKRMRTVFTGIGTAPLPAGLRLQQGSEGKKKRQAFDEIEQHLNP